MLQYMPQCNYIKLTVIERKKRIKGLQLLGDTGSGFFALDFSTTQP